jgi:EAL domain-containing protein (putative c-di-GMP-specific phosphodiesterase class I)
MATEPVPSAQSHTPAVRRRRTNTGGGTPPGPGVRPAWAQVHSLYQPVVHLQTRTVIGYEALARGPEGTDLYTPDALFAAARARGTFGELDWACRIAAFDGAVKAHLPSTLELFVNVEAAALNAPPPPGAAAALSAAGGLSVVIELTERDLTGDVAGLLRAVERARAQGWRVALDDVGAAPASLALLPFLRPEIIKLDLSLTHTTTNTATVEILTAVTAEAARTGATLLAEGIETEDHAQLAVRMGARLGQGWLFGRPAPLPTFPMRAPPPSRQRPLINVASRVLEAPPAARTTTLGTPYSVVVASANTANTANTAHTANTANTANTAKGAQRVATKPVLHAISTQLERRALAQGHSVVVLGAFQHARHFTGATAQRYRDLAVHSSYVAAFATDLSPTPCPVLTALPCPRTTRWSGSGASSSSPRCSPEP